MSGKSAILYSFDKFKELVLYVASKCQDDGTFGYVKLNKILYFSDFEAYRRLGQPITGAAYQHLREGPAPRQMLPAQRELLEEGAIGLEARPVGSYVQKRIVPKREADERMFRAEEREIVDSVIARLWGRSGAEVSAMSHEEWGWRLTEDGDTIHYRTAWLSPEPLTQEQLEVGAAIAEALHA